MDIREALDAGRRRVLAAVGTRHDTGDNLATTSTRRASWLTGMATRVVSQDGTRYDVAGTGTLRVRGGSDRAQRRAMGLSPRQWRRTVKARRRAARAAQAPEIR